MTSVLIQQASLQHKQMLDLTHLRHKEYCERHGFAFLSWRGKVLDRPDKGPTWCRLMLMENAFDNGADYVVVLDADTLIVDPSKDFREALPADQKIGMVKHPRGWKGREWHWNCGVIVARRESKGFWKQVIKAGHVVGQTWNEQGRINLISETAPDMFYELDARWNCAEHINPCANPIVKAWHGLGLAAILKLKEALALLVDQPKANSPIGQILPDSNFGKKLTEIASRSQTIVEIGCWRGGGSTVCLLAGWAGVFGDQQRMFCIDASPEMVLESRGRNPDPRITWLVGSVFPCHGWPVVIDQLPAKIDLLLIDGGKDCGKQDFEALHERCRIIAMDDVKLVKNNVNFRLLRDVWKWDVLAMNLDERHGWAIFERPQA